MKKKLLIFLGIFIFMIIPKNVSALTFNHNGEDVVVNDDTIIYYAYSVAPEIFDYPTIAIGYSSSQRFYEFIVSYDYRFWFNRVGRLNYSLPLFNNDLFLNLEDNLDLNDYPVDVFRFYLDNGNISFTQAFNSSFTYLDKVFYGCNLLHADSNATPAQSCDNLQEDVISYWDNTPNSYTITYYLNNEVYREIEVEEGSSHTLIDYTPEEDYNWSGWQYDSNIDLTNITQNIEIRGTSSPKPIYIITYYLDNKKYKETSVIEGHSHTLFSDPDYNKYTFSFSGWQYDSNIDLTNITEDIIITGTLSELQKTPVYIDFPISKEEFYCLLVLIANLNILIFLKWCFPYKMGGDLK